MSERNSERATDPAQVSAEPGSDWGGADEADPRSGERRSAVVPCVDDFFEMSLDHLCIASFDGYFKRLNASWTKTLGFSNEELMGEPSIHFVHPDDRETTLAGRARLVANSDLGPHRNRYRCKDGSYRWFEWRSVAHLDQGLVYAAARDITEAKLAEARLEQANALHEKLQRQLLFADRMASVGTLAAGVAHEINNPLAYVTANISLILEELPRLGEAPTAKQIADLTDMATDARNGAERIRKIVGGLKTFSRSEEERRAVIEITPVLELSISMTANEIRHRARLVKEFGNTPPVEADDARLGQVFINLLVNAAQAIPEGRTAINEIRIVTSTDEAGRAVIEIHDTGPGIPAAIIDRVFDPFFTTKPVGIGTGLGLSICHNLVAAMEGQLSVRSQVGFGTSFRVVLPAARAKSARTSDAPRGLAAGLASASVLVIDDEPAIGLVLRRILTGHRVTVVTAAKTALELLAAGERYDVVFSDLMMPEMSGMDFYDEVAARFPSVLDRIVFISGGAFTPGSNAFLDRVPNECMGKPFDARSTRELVGRFVGSRPQALGDGA